MPEVIFTGPAGRLEGRYHPAKQKNAPIAMVLHPHPQFHGTMNHQIVYQCYYAFAHRGFSVLPPPAGEGAGPVRGHQAQVAGSRRRADRG